MDFQAAGCGLFFTMLLYQIIILVGLLVFLGIILRNLVDLPDLPSASEVPLQGPRVSVLVPARDEERNIAACVTTLLAQQYEDFEVIVLDDHSRDGTWRELQKLVDGAGGKRLRILEGAALPEGWHGKAWACQQLATHASGELLLFTDADTRHRPETLRRSVAAIGSCRAGMLSLTPAQELGTFWEGLVVPLVYHILFSYLPIGMVRASRSPAFCYAIGQFILFRREVYRQIGGHRSVCRNIVEDVWLCKKVKQSGGTVVTFNGADAVSCRMYHGLFDIWNGFSKNLYAGLGNNAFVLFTLMLLVVLLYLVPWYFAASSLLGGALSIDGFWLPVLQICLAVISRLIISVKCRQPLWPGLLHALSQVMLLLIAMNSLRQTAFGGGPVWKGRSYPYHRECGGKGRIDGGDHEQ
ncbi:MAG: glycosyltransferase [Chlorobiaceae bacterium]|nr:glycosyltransferase [Chlorobiaceae bacterium]